MSADDRMPMRLISTRIPRTVALRLPLCALVALMLAVQLPLALRAQRKEAPKYSARVDLVSVDVEVLDRQGNNVTGLGKEAFAIKENGRLQQITHFAEWTDRPVSLAFVLDVSGMPRPQLSMAKQFIFRLVHILSPGDELCLFTFNDRDATLEQDFTRDRAPLLEALRQIDVSLGRTGALFKDLMGRTPLTGLAIDLALHKLRKASNEKRAVLVISNRFKGLGPATVEHIQESGFTLLTLGFSNTSNWMITLGGDAMSKNALMKESGGRKFSAESGNVTATCRAIAQSVKTHYSLGYPTEVGSGRQKRRKLEVAIPGRNDYVIHARRSYVPPP
jgi:VWFA-related protein